MDGLHNNTICGVIDGEHKSTSSHPEPSEKHLPFKKRLCNRDAVTNLNMRRDETAGDTATQLKKTVDQLLPSQLSQTMTH